jgi:trk system potassium uptake protein
MRVVIAGAGSVGRSIARELLHNGHSVLLVDKDADDVQAGRVPEASWLLADACEITALHEAGLAECDVVVAATGDDEDNLVVSLLAKQEFAVPRVIARVNHPKNQWMFNATWGVDIAVSTPHLITSLVDEAVSVGRLVRLFQLEGGMVQLVEVTLADDAPVAGQAIKDLDVPRDATFVAIIRDDHVVMARGDTVMQAGDEVLALVTPDSEDLVRQMLTAR